MDSSSYKNTVYRLIYYTTIPTDIIHFIIAPLIQPSFSTRQNISCIDNPIGITPIPSNISHSESNFLLWNQFGDYAIFNTWLHKCTAKGIFPLHPKHMLDSFCHIDSTGIHLYTTIIEMSSDKYVQYRVSFHSITPQNVCVNWRRVGCVRMDDTFPEDPAVYYTDTFTTINMRSIEWINLPSANVTNVMGAPIKRV